jgi:hypothetical protein
MIPALTITETSTEDIAVLRLGGSLDLPGATALLAAVTDLAGTGPRAIICDLLELQDTPEHHLLTVFPAAQRRLGTWFRHELFLTGASSSLGRSLDRLRVDRFVTVRATLADAVAAGRHRLTAAYHHLEMPPELSSPAVARRSLRALGEEGTTPWLHVAEVIISELAANAVRHVREPFAVDLAVRPSELLVGVTDSSRQEPILRPRRTGADGGRGIQLIAALSTSWGVRLVHDGGKTVWARIGAPAVA